LGEKAVKPSGDKEVQNRIPQEFETLKVKGSHVFNTPSPKRGMSNGGEE